MSSPQPRELPSPFQFDKDFTGVVDKDFSIRQLDADDLVTPEAVAVPKAEVSSVTGPAASQSSESESQTDLIPPPEDLTVPVEEGPSQLPSEEDSLQVSSSKTSPGVFVPPVLGTPTPTSSSPNEAT